MHAVDSALWTSVNRCRSITLTHAGTYSMLHQSFSGVYHDNKNCMAMTLHICSKIILLVHIYIYIHNRNILPKIDPL